MRVKKQRLILVCDFFVYKSYLKRLEYLAFLLGTTTNGALRFCLDILKTKGELGYEKEIKRLKRAYKKKEILLKKGTYNFFKEETIDFAFKQELMFK